MKIFQKPRKFAIMLMLAVFLMAQAGIAGAASSFVADWNIPKNAYHDNVSATVYSVSDEVYATVYASVYSYKTGDTVPIEGALITQEYVYGADNAQQISIPMPNTAGDYSVNLAVYSATYADMVSGKWTEELGPFSSGKFTLNQRPSGSSGSSGGPITTSATVNASKGGTISGQGATISIPAGALDSNVKVTISKVLNTSGLKLAAGSKYVSDVLEIIKDIAGDFSKAVTITLNFDKSKVDADKYDLKLCYYDETNSTWVPLDNIKVDMAAGKVSGDVTHFTKFAVIAFEKGAISLSDIKGNWAEANILKLVELGAITGYPDGTFKPDNNITRAEFVTVLVKAFKVAPGSKSFADAANHWAKDSIAAAASAGIVNGFSETSFGPDANITREQMAVMIANAAKLPQADASKTFTDGANIADWAKASVDAATAAGIINGYPDGSFKPQANATRAEAATMIIKALGK